MKRPAACILGSVKSNIGHLEVASGIAGLVKTILCLKHRAIPATLHYTSPNPELHLERGPFVVGTEYGPWAADGVRRAGVSSFGVGGTNVHIVVEEAPQAPARQSLPGPQVLLLSARTVEGLRELRSELGTELSRADARTCPMSPSPSPADAPTSSGWRPSCTTASTRHACSKLPSTTTPTRANRSKTPNRNPGWSSSFPGRVPNSPNGPWVVRIRARVRREL